jgi:beta-xylosidase
LNHIIFIKFYLLFITLNEGGFMCIADKAEGPWKITHLPKGFYDAGLFFDDDGKIYVAQGYNKISITEVDTNFSPIGNCKGMVTSRSDCSNVF